MAIIFCSVCTRQTNASRHDSNTARSNTLSPTVSKAHRKYPGPRVGLRRDLWASSDKLCTHTHTHGQNRKQGFFRVGTAYCSQCLLHIQKSQTEECSRLTDWLDGRRREAGVHTKGSRVTKYFIRTHHEQFIGVALLQQHYGHIKGKPQARWENPPFHNHSQSLFMNSFNYVLAIGSNHTILDKSLLGVNNTLILYKLS